ncbi:MAG: ABC transporter permease [Planctomycetota bacterium]
MSAARDADRPRHPVVELTLARFREFWREPGAVFWAFGFPLLLALSLGIAFREGEPSVPRLAYSPGVLASEVVEAIDAAQAAGHFEAVEVAPEEAERLLAIGAVDLRLDQRAGSASESAALLYVYDPSRPASRGARVVVDDALQRAVGRTDPLGAADLTRVVPGSRYVDFLIPGIIGMSLMSSTVWGIGYSIILARKRKQLKRLAATPMRRLHFMLANFLSRLIFLIAEVVVLIAFGWLVFRVGVDGSVLALTVVSLLGTSAFAGLALVVAARVESVEAANGWLNFSTLPMWMLSGVFFSYERFPEFAHLPIQLLPLTALNDGLRAVMNQGAGIGGVAFELAVLAVWSMGGFVVAARRFRWQ